MTASFQSNGPMSVTGNVTIATNSLDIIADTDPGEVQATSAKGVAELTLKKSGTPLASARILAKNIPLDGYQLGVFSAGTEGDNGSTTSKINYILNQTDHDNGLYSLEYVYSGNTGGGFVRFGSSTEMTVSGSGHVTGEITSANRTF